jgi:hypothetical protein
MSDAFVGFSLIVENAWSKLQNLLPYNFNIPIASTDDTSV